MGSRCYRSGWVGAVAGGAAVGGVPGALVGGALGLAGSLLGGEIKIPVFKKTEEGEYVFIKKSNTYKNYSSYLFKENNPVLSTDLIEMNDKGQIPLSQVNIKLDIQDPGKNDIHKLRLKEMDSIFSEIDRLINGKKSVKKDKAESKQKTKVAEEPNIDEEIEAKAIAKVESQEVPGEYSEVKVEDK